MSSKRAFVAGTIGALENLAEYEDAELLRFKLRALVDAFDAKQRKRRMKKDEIEITVRLAGEPSAVVDALANGLPRPALEALRDRLCAAVIERQIKPGRGRRRVSITVGNKRKDRTR